jgi:ketosteroid isomerase-like protein
MRTFILVLALACSTTASRAQDTTDPDAASKVVALENLWNQAAEAKDLVALDRILDDAFVYVDPDGKLLTKADVMANVKSSQGIRATFESVLVRLHGDTAIVTGVYKISGIDRGRPFLRRNRFVDTWLYKNNSWVSIASLATLIAS